MEPIALNASLSHLAIRLIDQIEEVLIVVEKPVLLIVTPEVLTDDRQSVVSLARSGR